MEKFKVKYKDRVFRVTAKDADSAVDAVKTVVNEVEDERLSPMTYSKLKEMGYGPDDWKNMTQEQANKVVAEGRKTEQSNQSTQQTKQPTQNKTKSRIPGVEKLDNYHRRDFSKIVKKFNIDPYNIDSVEMVKVDNSNLGNYGHAYEVSVDGNKAQYGFNRRTARWEELDSDGNFASDIKAQQKAESKAQSKAQSQLAKQQREEQVKSTKINLTPDNGFSDGEFAEFVQSSLGENYNPENLTVKTVVDLWEEWNGNTWEYNGRQYPGYDLSYETRAKLLKQEGEINF